MTNPITTHYAVAEIASRKIVYLGPCEKAAAKALVPGTLYGTGASRTAAKLTVERNIAWTRGVGRVLRRRPVHP